MNIGAISRRVAGTGAVTTALLALALVANASADVTPIWSTSCGDPALSQPFLAWGDSTCYALAPGESQDSFSATGWTLSGGAKIVTTTLSNGTQGSVLDLPSGGTAVSPVVSMNSAHPYVRAMVNSANHGAAKLSVAYLGANGFGSPRQAGVLTTPHPTWTLSHQLKLPDNPKSTWQQAQFTLLGTGPKANGDTRIYNLYFLTTSSASLNSFSGDPRMH
jgi:hypothetical protein